MLESVRMLLPEVGSITGQMSAVAGRNKLTVLAGRGSSEQQEQALIIQMLASHKMASSCSCTDCLQAQGARQPDAHLLSLLALLQSTRALPEHAYRMYIKDAIVEGDAFGSHNCIMLPPSNHHEGRDISAKCSAVTCCYRACSAVCSLQSAAQQGNHWHKAVSYLKRFILLDGLHKHMV